MNFEINKELVLSTAHIKYETSLWLNQQSPRHSCEYGYRVWVGQRSEDLPEELNHLLGLAKGLDWK